MDNNLKNSIDIAVKKSTDKMYNIKEVAKILKVDYSGTFEEICENIYKHLLKYKRKPAIKYFLSKFNKEDLGFYNILIDSLYELFFPSLLSKKSPINITEAKYKRLIKERKKERPNINIRDNILLDNALHIKFCHCIKKLYLKNIIRQEFSNIKGKYNPYAICTSSIYKNRDFNVPPSAARKCRKSYDWYRKTNYGKLKQTI